MLSEASGLASINRDEPIIENGSISSDGTVLRK